MKAMTRVVNDHGVTYEALMFICPGCESFNDDGTGLHMLPVNSPNKTPSWDWDGDLIRPTLSPSILTNMGQDDVCHSFLKEGTFSFLDDCTHSMAGQEVEMPDLPQWVVDEKRNK